MSHHQDLETLKIGLLGQDISHSLSPLLQQMNAKSVGRDLEYTLCDLARPDAERFLSLKSKLDERHKSLGSLASFDGINVTTPYKELAFGLADMASEEALCLGAANTLVLRDDLLHAHNTDPEGVKALLTGLGALDHCQRVILLGTGGASRAAALTLARSSSCDEIIWVSRDRQRGADCLSWCHEQWPHIDCYWLSADASDQMILSSKIRKEQLNMIKGKATTLISGAPPLSMKKWSRLEEVLRPTLGERFSLKEGAFLIDLNYGEERVRGSQHFAQSLGVAHADGLRMLHAQGVASFKWWTGHEISQQEQWPIFERAVN